MFLHSQKDFGPTLAYDADRSWDSKGWPQQDLLPPPPLELHSVSMAYEGEVVSGRHHFFEGDPYAETDDVSRSVCLAEPGMDCNWLPPNASSKTGFKTKEPTSAAAFAKIAPRAPEPRYYFSSTTLKVLDLSAPEIWALLHDFAKEYTNPWIETAKCKIQASYPKGDSRQEMMDEMDDAPGCELRIRLYQLPGNAETTHQTSGQGIAGSGTAHQDGGFAVEFRRTRGDAVAFSLVFGKFWELLKKRSRACSPVSAKPRC